MNITTIKKVPSADEIIQMFPLSEAGHLKITKDKNEIKNILSGKDSRLLMIIGPCSAWPSEAVLEYAKRLKNLEEKISDVIKLVMRVYIQKPRTTKGWTGPVNQPNPFAEPDIEEGIKYTRSLMVKIIELGLPIADEALFTHNARGFLELLSWVAIGARSVEDQEHRIFASAVDCPVGMKNPTSGSIEIGVNSIVAAQHPHLAVFDRHQVQTHGNPYAHLVLRGGVEGPNYSLNNLEIAKKEMDKHKIKNEAVIIDVSHDNCKVQGKKIPLLQVEIIKEVISERQGNALTRELVKGFMVESFLKEGNQNVEQLTPEEIDQGGLSITDPCLGWEKTEAMLLDLANDLRN